MLQARLVRLGGISKVTLNGTCTEREACEGETLAWMGEIEWGLRWTGDGLKVGWRWAGDGLKVG